MLKIRLQRVGRTHEPAFRLVLTDSQNGTKSGKYLENLGNYDARRGADGVFNTERIQHWLSKGAQPSTTVHNLLISRKITTGKKLNPLPLKKAIVKDAPIEEVKPAPVVESVPAVETPTEAPVVEAEAPAVEPAPAE